MSCSGNNQKQEKQSTETDRTIKEVWDAEIDSLLFTGETVVNEVFDIDKFYLQCDSLLKKLKGARYSFEIKSDTFNFFNDNPEVFNFGHGLFSLLYRDTTERVVRHYIFEPNTRKQFRIYLVEADYVKSKHLNSKMETLRERMDVKLSLLGNGGFIKMRLSPLNDYVIASEKKLYWLNAAYPYSNSEFLQFVDVLRNNIDTNIFKGRIICLFGSDCRTENVP